MPHTEGDSRRPLGHVLLYTSSLLCDINNLFNEVQLHYNQNKWQTQELKRFKCKQWLVPNIFVVPERHIWCPCKKWRNNILDNVHTLVYVLISCKIKKPPSLTTLRGFRQIKSKCIYAKFHKNGLNFTYMRNFTKIHFLIILLYFHPITLKSLLFHYRVLFILYPNLSRKHAFKIWLLPIISK